MNILASLIMRINGGSIIFVHGFFAGRETAWRGSTGSWLDNLLPGDLPQARIMVFGYDVNPMFKFNEAGLILFYEALQRRKAMRSETRPLIFVAHGLGGIVVKAVLTLYPLSYSKRVLIKIRLSFILMSSKMQLEMLLFCLNQLSVSASLAPPNAVQAELVGDRA